MPWAKRGVFVLQTVELAILDWIQNTLRCDFLDALVPMITKLNDNGEVWILLAVVLVCMKKYRRAGLSVGAGLGLNLLVCNQIMKPLFGRIRPFMVNTAVDLLVKAPSSGAFPSGHTASSFAVVGALWAAKSPLWKPAAVLASLIALSRLYLYVHWPTDILGGIVVGWVCGVLAAKVVAAAADALRRKKEH